MIADWHDAHARGVGVGGIQQHVVRVRHDRRRHEQQPRQRVAKLFVADRLRRRRVNMAKT